TVTAETTVDGGGLITLSGGNAARVFGVDSGALTVKQLTIADGLDQSNNGGGGISNFLGNVTVIGCTLRANRALGGGGGISNNGGTVTVIDSTFDGNTTPGTGGGGIASASMFTSTATLRVSGSTFSGNDAAGGAGGGILAIGGTATV